MIGDRSTDQSFSSHSLCFDGHSWRCIACSNVVHIPQAFISYDIMFDMNSVQKACGRSTKQVVFESSLSDSSNIH